MFSEYPKEARWLMASLLLGVLASVGAVSWSQYFLANFLANLVPQAVIVGIAVPISKRPSAASGVAIALALYLVAFVAWVEMSSSKNWNGFSYVAYLFSLPGGAIGALIAVSGTRYIEIRSSIVIALVTGASTIAGLALNALVLCQTLVYCGP